MSTIMHDPTKPTPFAKYLEEKRKLTEASQEHPGMEFDTSPKQVMKELSGSKKQSPSREGSVRGVMSPFKSSSKKEGFQERVQERLKTSGSSTGSGIAFYNQGKSLGFPKSASKPTPAEAELEEAAEELAAAAMKLENTTLSIQSQLAHAPVSVSPVIPASPAVKAPKFSAVPPIKSSGDGHSAEDKDLGTLAHSPSPSLKLFSKDSPTRVKPKVTTPKFTPVSPGLILAQQHAGPRASSTGPPPPSAGGSIIHAMETGRVVTAQSRLGTGVTGNRPTSSAGGIKAGETAMATAKEMVKIRQRKLELANLAKQGVLTDEEYEEHLRRSQFNFIVSKLKEKMSTTNAGVLTLHFSTLDFNGDGVLQPSEFRKALSSLNLGAEVDDYIFNELMDAADLDGDHVINYNEFAQAVRLGKIPFKQFNPNIRIKTLPDPDNPFGDPDTHMNLPFGIQSDALENIKAFDKRIDSLYKSLEETFLEFDEDDSGEVDLPEFKKAMTKMRESKGLHLSDDEIKDLFRSADYDHSGAINWQEFVHSFQGGAGKRFIPEFLKPKSMRCSQMGAPWEWRADVDELLKDAPKSKMNSHRDDTKENK